MGHAQYLGRESLECASENWETTCTLRSACDSAQIGTGNLHSTATLKSLPQYQPARSKYPIRILFQVNICFRILLVKNFFFEWERRGLHVFHISDTQWLCFIRRPNTLVLWVHDMTLFTFAWLWANGYTFDTSICMTQHMHVDSDDIWCIKTSSVQLSQYYHTWIHCYLRHCYT